MIETTKLICGWIFLIICAKYSKTLGHVKSTVPTENSEGDRFPTTGRISALFEINFQVFNKYIVGLEF